MLNVNGCLDGNQCRLPDLNISTTIAIKNVYKHSWSPGGESLRLWVSPDFSLSCLDEADICGLELKVSKTIGLIAQNKSDRHSCPTEDESLCI